MAIGVGRLGGDRPRLATVALLPFLALLLVNSWVSRGGPILPSSVPLFATTPRVAAPPATDADLRNAVLDRVGGEGLVAVAGSHPHLNVDNLRLRAVERGSRVGFDQVFWLGPDLAPEERVRRMDHATGWLVIEGPTPVPGAEVAAPVQAFLAADPERFRRHDWSGRLDDGTMEFSRAARLAIPEAAG